ncbi:MAG: hypothetical protein LH618_13085, partial [Saprospiraceae bacterium]|nr:hypothetical protein [Saprospiraceae bacterium]
KDINEAYSILQNRNEKELYDKTYENFENNNYKENLKKLNVIRNSLKEELAFMIVKKIISQDSFPNIQ